MKNMKSKLELIWFVFFIVALVAFIFLLVFVIKTSCNSFSKTLKNK